MGSVSSQNGYRLAAFGIEILRPVIVYAPPSASEDHLTAPQGASSPSGPFTTARSPTTMVAVEAAVASNLILGT
jgi:hypothetical protein